MKRARRSTVSRTGIKAAKLAATLARKLMKEGK